MDVMPDSMDPASNSAPLETRIDQSYVEITDAARLVEIAMSEGHFDFTLNGNRCRVRIRALTSDEAAEVNKIDAGITAPKKPSSNPSAYPEYDENDPGYLARREAALRRKVIAVFNQCLLSFKIPGEDSEEQTRWLHQKLSRGVSDEIYAEIWRLTNRPIEGALFTRTGS